MGMTIDKAISWLLSIAEHEGDDIPIYDTDVEAIKLAIEIIHKYQKIEEIVNDRYGKPVFKTLDEVIKVVEDGNNNS